MNMKVFSCKNGVINLLELQRIKGLYDEEHCSSIVIVLGVIREKKALGNTLLKNATRSVFFVGYYSLFSFENA